MYQSEEKGKSQLISTSTRKGVALQKKGLDIIQRHNCPVLTNLADNNVGRAHNAGIVDEDIVVPATGLQFTQHFHCNGWTEATRTFTSFTGTFVVAGTTHHYTIAANGTGNWVGAPGAPAAGAIGMVARTEQKFANITAAA